MPERAIPTTTKGKTIMCRTCMVALPKCLCFGTAHEMSLWAEAIRSFVVRARSRARWGGV